jgi:hypothetical protein
MATRSKSAAPTGPAGRALRRFAETGWKCDHRPERNRRDARGLKIEIGPVYAG